MYTDTTPMPFGKHKGKELQEVPASYLLWLYEEKGFKKSERHQNLKAYIEDNMEVLEKEIEENTL